MTEKEKDESNRDDFLICRCKEVTKKEIQELIDKGVTTLRGIKLRTRAGMGLCQGKTCSRLITKMLIKSGVKPSSINPPSVRPPLRALKLKEINTGDK